MIHIIKRSPWKKTLPVIKRFSFSIIDEILWERDEGYVLYLIKAQKLGFLATKGRIEVGVKWVYFYLLWILTLRKERTRFTRHLLENIYLYHGGVIGSEESVSSLFELDEPFDSAGFGVSGTAGSPSLLGVADFAGCPSLLGSVESSSLLSKPLFPLGNMLSISEWGSQKWYSLNLFTIFWSLGPFWLARIRFHAFVTFSGGLLYPAKSERAAKLPSFRYSPLRWGCGTGQSRLVQRTGYSFEKKGVCGMQNVNLACLTAFLPLDWAGTLG